MIGVVVFVVVVVTVVVELITAGGNNKWWLNDVPVKIQHSYMVTYTTQTD